MIPQQYTWLEEEKAPRMIVAALKLHGVQERAGPEDNPIILEWAKELRIKGYTADSIPWCGLFMAIVAKRANKSIPAQPLWARDWLNWGKKSPIPQLGDALIFRRSAGGHVGIYIGEDKTCFHVLGGNQGDAVSIKRLDKARLLGARREYKIGAPDNVRIVALSEQGETSDNEA